GWLRQGRSGRHLQRRAEFIGQDGGERRLAQPGWPVEQDVWQRLLEFLAGVEDDRETFLDGLLTDDFLHPFLPQGGIYFLIGTAALDDCLTGHVVIPIEITCCRSSATRPRPTRTSCRWTAPCRGDCGLPSGCVPERSGPGRPPPARPRPPPLSGP